MDGAGEGRATRERQAVQRVAERLRATFGAPPEALITLGSGLGPVLERATLHTRVPTTELGLPESTVPGHAGQAILATLGPARVLFLSGRVHFYEGYTMDEVVRYVRAAAVWGVSRLILTCSAGSLRADLSPGTVTRLVDHINLMGTNPLIGGPLLPGEHRFPDASQAHDPSLSEALIRASQALETPLPPAVYVALTGPAYESSAEVRMLHRMGADLAGMSTVPELLAARALDLPTLALAVVSNYGAGVGDGQVDHAQVTAVAGAAAGALARVLETMAAEWVA